MGIQGVDARRAARRAERGGHATGFPELVRRSNRWTNAHPTGTAEFSRWSSEPAFDTGKAVTAANVRERLAR